MVIKGISSVKRALQVDKIGEGPLLGRRDAELPEGICVSFLSIFSTITTWNPFFYETLKLSVMCS